MSWVDLLLEFVRPGTALLIAGLGFYLRVIRKDIKEELGRVRKRLQRLEGAYIPDGGEDLGEDDQ